MQDVFKDEGGIEDEKEVLERTVRKEVLEKLSRQMKNKIYISKYNFLNALEQVIGSGYKKERKEAMIAVIFKHTEVHWE